MGERVGWPIRLGRWLRDSSVPTYALNIASVAAIGWAGIATVVLKETPTAFVIWMFISGVGALVLEAVRSLLRGSEMKRVRAKLTAAEAGVAQRDLQLEVTQQAAQDAVDQMLKTSESMLKWVSTKHEFGPSERLTLYGVDGLEAIIVGRHSRDSVFNMVSAENRTYRHDLDYGLVGRVCRTKQRETKASGPPPGAKGEYRSWQHRSCGLKDIGRLRMKSRLYDVLPVFNEPSGTDLVGILAIESTEPFKEEVCGLGDLIQQGDQLLCGMLVELVRLNSSMWVAPAESEEVAYAS